LLVSPTMRGRIRCDGAPADNKLQSSANKPLFNGVAASRT
jgi:hypothetical protein